MKINICYFYHDKPELSAFFLCTSILIDCTHSGQYRSWYFIIWMINYGFIDIEPFKNVPLTSCRPAHEGKVEVKIYKKAIDHRQIVLLMI